MTEWKISPQERSFPTGKVQKLKTYTLMPGDVHLYPIGVIHSPVREPGKLIHIEGQSLAKVGKTSFEPI